MGGVAIAEVSTRGGGSAKAGCELSFVSHGGPGLSAATDGDSNGYGGIATIGDDGGSAVTIGGGVSELFAISSGVIPVGKPTG